MVVHRLCTRGAIAGHAGDTHATRMITRGRLHRIRRILGCCSGTAAVLLGPEAPTGRAAREKTSVPRDANNNRGAAPRRHPQGWTHFGAAITPAAVAVALICPQGRGEPTAAGGARLTLSALTAYRWSVGRGVGLCRMSATQILIVAGDCRHGGLSA